LSEPDEEPELKGIPELVVWGLVLAVLVLWFIPIVEDFGTGKPIGVMEGEQDETSGALYDLVEW
jgi:hypothetical protein